MSNTPSGNPRNPHSPLNQASQCQPPRILVDSRQFRLRLSANVRGIGGVLGVKFFHDRPADRLPGGSLQIAAFAHEITAFETVAAYEASQTGDLKYTSQSFIPSGLFTPAGDSGAISGSFWLSGVIG